MEEMAMTADYAAQALDALPPELVERARACFDGQDPAHDWFHNLRVISLCERIGREEGADMQVLRLAALLHDIGRAEERQTGECHAQISAHRAAEWLREQGMDEAVIRRIQQSILAHRFRKGHPPETLEEKILYDADKLDSIGAIGVARAFVYSGVLGQPLQTDDPAQHTPAREFAHKLSTLKDRLFTASARQLAEERHRFMAAFFARWEQELRGLV